MEPDSTQVDPVDEAAASPVAPSEESASAASAEQVSAESVAQMNAMIRGGLAARDAGSASKSDGNTGDESASDPDGASASSEDVKPSDAPASGRRGAAAEIARLKAEKAQLQSALDAVNPPPPDPTEEARAVRIEKENRYRRLLVKPDTDLDWDGDDWNFLQDEKQKRALHPELQQHYDTILAEDLKAREADFNSRTQGFQDYVLQGMAAVKGLPGIDFEAVQKARDFVEREQLIYRAGVSVHEPEIKRLREENAELRRDLGGAVRAPLAGGRSGAGRTYDANGLMNHLIRGGRA